MEMKPVRIHRPRPSRKLVPFEPEIWSAHQFGKERQPNRGHREAHIPLPEADVRSSVNRIALGTIIGEQPWREMLAANKAKRAITARCWAITRGRAAVGPCTAPPATSPWR